MTADVAYPSKDPNQRQHNKQHQQQRRNSGSATSSTIEQQQWVTPSSCQSATSLPMMATTTRTPPITVNRSRLVQELLEQNSAMLLKLKDRPKVTTSAGLSSLSLHNDNEPDLGDGHDQQRTSLNNSNSANSPIHHHPFPRQGTRTPKDVTVKLGLYSPTQKFWLCLQPPSYCKLCWLREKDRSIIPNFYIEACIPMFADGRDWCFLLELLLHLYTAEKQCSMDEEKKIANIQ